MGYVCYLLPLKRRKRHSSGACTGAWQIRLGAVARGSVVVDMGYGVLLWTWRVVLTDFQTTWSSSGLVRFLSGVKSGSAKWKTARNRPEFSLNFSPFSLFEGLEGAYSTATKCPWSLVVRYGDGNGDRARGAQQRDAISGGWSWGSS